MSQTMSSAHPCAMISRSALTAAAAAAVATGGRVADLRRDAWGHGLLGMAHAVTAAGASTVLVDSDMEIEALRLEGIDGVLDDTADIDSRLLYGLPDDDGVLVTRPVLRLTGTILSTKVLSAGDAVSYGYTYRAATDTTVALVTGGYAQGIVRALGNRASVEVNGAERPIVGRVAMDVCVVDLQDDAQASAGTAVTYFGGEGCGAANLAAWSAVTGLRVTELAAVAAAHAERGWEA